MAWGVAEALVHELYIILLRCLMIQKIGGVAQQGITDTGAKW
jgi:hypothetical protein